MKRHPRRQERRQEAAERQAEYDQLTLEEKIARAQSRRGNSARELARLQEEKAHAG